MSDLQDWAEPAARELRALREELEELKIQLHRLRGRFAQARQVEADDDPAPQSREARRAAAFKKFGVTPGKPVNHT